MILITKYQYIYFTKLNRFLSSDIHQINFFLNVEVEKLNAFCFPIANKKECVFFLIPANQNF